MCLGGRNACKENRIMKHNAPSGYNIYTPKRKRRSDRKLILGLSCLCGFLILIILLILFVPKLFSGKKSDTTDSTPTNTSTVQTNGSENAESETSSVPSDTSETSATRAQAVDAATRAANLESLKASVADYLSQQSGRYSVYYINMQNGETMGYMENQPMVAASTIKIAYNTYLYEKAVSGELSLQEKITYNAAEYPNGDFEAGTGTIQNSPDGTEFTLQEVSHLSITVSDNCGTNMVLRRLGGEDAVNDNYMKTISSVVNYREKYTYTDYAGVEKTGMRRTSAIDLAKYTEHLYKDYVGNETAFQPLIDDLCNTEYDWGVPAGVSDDIKVAHKIGFYPSLGTYNDAGIVFSTEDYVLCVLTESGDEPQAKKIIGEVSRMVYEYVESNYI